MVEKSKISIILPHTTALNITNKLIVTNINVRLIKLFEKIT